MSRALPGTQSRRRVYLMRHAQVSYFDKEGRPLDPRAVALTEEGRSQASAAAGMLAGIPLDAAVCSGMPRTLETARIVLGQRAVTLEEEPRLREARAGRLREVPVESLQRVVAYAYEGAGEPGATFIGGETWEGFAGRVRAAWADLLQRSDWLHLLVVAHDGVNRVVLSDVAASGLPGMRAFEQDPACVNIIDVDAQPGVSIDGWVAGRAILRAVNVSAYDLAKAGVHQTVMEKVFGNYRRDA